jgi:hypothetical protein
MERDYLLKYFFPVTGAGIFSEVHNEVSDEGRPLCGVSIGNVIYEDKEWNCLGVGAFTNIFIICFSEFLKNFAQENP